MYYPTGRLRDLQIFLDRSLLDYSLHTITPTGSLRDLQIFLDSSLLYSLHTDTMLTIVNSVCSGYIKCIKICTHAYSHNTHRQSHTHINAPYTFIIKCVSLQCDKYVSVVSDMFL